MVWKGDYNLKQSFVYATNQVEFIHRWKDAPEEVAYLRNLHRHIAHIKTQIEVFHEDREIEFIMLKHRVQNYIEKVVYEDNCSCEKLADMLLCYLQDNYGKDRDIIITVSEDNENGVELVYRKEKTDAKNLEGSRDGGYQHWYNEFIRVQ